MCPGFDLQVNLDHRCAFGLLLGAILYFWHFLTLIIQTGRFVAVADAFNAKRGVHHMEGMREVSRHDRDAQQISAEIGAEDIYTGNQAARTQR
jgi:hypothetical protein